MMLAFVAAGIGNLIRTKLIKHHFTLYMNIAVSVSAACLVYALLLKAAELAFHIPAFLKPDISAQCCSSYRDFHSSPAV